LKNEKDEPQALIYSTSYIRTDVKDPARPISFIYNGGPGSASVWLHMGAFGPRRVLTPNAESTPPAPYKLADNAGTLLRGGQSRAFHQSARIFGLRKFARFVQKRVEVRGLLLQHFVIGSRRRVARDVENVRQVFAGMEGDGSQIEHRGNQDDAVEVHALMFLQIIPQRGGAERAVTFADQEFRRIPDASIRVTPARPTTFSANMRSLTRRALR